jgi:cytochrome oxidase assembly protein ShyY1
MSARALLTRRSILLVLVSLVVAVTCVRLGFWQLDRLHGRRAANALFEHRLALPPTTLDQVVPRQGPAAGPIYRRVTVHGAYDTADEVVLFGRELDGEPGNHVLTPLQTSDGRTLVVDRGWVPIDDDRPPVAVATPPAGPVDVTGILFPSEHGSDSASANGRVTRVGAIDLGLIGQGLPSPIESVFLQLRSQTPAQPGPLPRTVPLPVFDDGPHLGYAVQWFIFAIIALVGGVVLLRMELVGGPGEGEPAPDPESDRELRV